ncbi:Hypothetical protein A7982_06569 [Minicystis rosea]|nr:Hypothetical protein A7982_06569 [Minicystis rosea]
MTILPRIVSLGALPILVGAVAVACGGVEKAMEASSTTGSGGAGGEATTTSSSTTTTTTTTTGSGGTGGDNGMPSDVYPAPHPTPPTVINYGGPVLKTPKIIPVFFANDDATMIAQIKDFSSKVGGTAYWTANTKEYGVGVATAGDAVELTEEAPSNIDDTDIQTWLAGKLNGDDPAWPAADANTVYVLNYPSGTTITSQGAGSCTSFGGYHSNITLDDAHAKRDVAYAVIPRCDFFGEMTGIDAVTATSSHEIIEASTDPYPMTNPTYAMMDDQHIYWLRVLGGGETADMCAQFDNAFTQFDELPYVVQRSWSNKAAKAGHDPCVPALPNAVYFNAAPVLPDNVTYSLYGQQVTVKGVKIPLGESKTIELDLFSDGPTGGPWTVEAKDVSALFGQKAKLDLVLDRDSGQNGEKLHLTITVNGTGMNKTESFIVESTLDGQKNIWIGVVGN